MSIFNGLVNLAEALAFPLFLAVYFDFENKRFFIIFSAIIQFLFLNYFYLINQSGIWLTLTIILFNIFTIFIKNKKVTFEHIIIVLFYNLCIIATSFLSLLFFDFVLKMTSLVISDNVRFIAICIFAKMILLFGTAFILQGRTKFRINLDIISWRPLLYFQFALIAALCYITNALVNQRVTLESIVILSVYILVINIFFLVIINKVVILEREKLNTEKKLQKEKFDKEKAIVLKDVRNQIDEIDHRLFYIILQIEYYIKANDTDNISKLIKKYKDLLAHHQMVVSTGNEMFDILLTLKINALNRIPINVKILCLISKRDAYNNFEFIDFLSELLNSLTKSTYVHINILEISNYLKIQILSDVSLETEDELSMNIDRWMQSLNGSFNINQINEKQLEIKLVVPLERFE